MIQNEPLPISFLTEGQTLLLLDRKSGAGLSEICHPPKAVKARP
jgi:hypothetical protein